VRSLAILPQSPRFNEADRRREGELRKVYEQSARAIRRVELDRLTSPQYKASEEQYAVLEKFDSRRELNSPKDVAGAFYTFGRMARVPPGSQLTMPPQEQQRMEMLQEDVISSLPFLDSRRLCNVLLSAAYQQNRDPQLLAPLCAHTLEKAHQLNLRDVTTLIYSLGRLEHREDGDALLRALLGRVEAELPRLHAVEMVLLTSGLAALRLKLPDLLQSLGRAALDKLETFGAVELSTLLGSLTTLSHKDLSLLRASASRLPEVVGGMNPRALCEMSAAFAAADRRVWIPSALDVLADESVAKARLFSQPQAAACLAAFGVMRWDHAGLVAALGDRLADFGPRLQLGELGLGLEGISRLPSGSEPETLRRLLDAAQRLRLPPLHHAGDAERRDAATLCSALRHLAAPPPAPLLRWLEMHAAESAEEATLAIATARERSGADTVDDGAKSVVRFRRRNAAQLNDSWRFWRGEDSGDKA